MIFKPTDIQIRDLGYMFQKMWHSNDLGAGTEINGFTKALDALHITWRLVPDKYGDDFEAVVIADKPFKL